MSVLIVTSVGDIVVDLHTDRCPLTSKNFLKLCKYAFWRSYHESRYHSVMRYIYILFLILCLCRMKYYNGCLFHKVEKDFLAQTGDRTGTGTGGDSVYKLVFFPSLFFFCNDWAIIYHVKMLQFRHFSRLFGSMYSLLMKFARNYFSSTLRIFWNIKLVHCFFFLLLSLLVGGSAFSQCKGFQWAGGINFRQ